MVAPLRRVPRLGNSSLSTLSYQQLINQFKLSYFGTGFLEVPAPRLLLWYVVILLSTCLILQCSGQQFAL